MALKNCLCATGTLSTKTLPALPLWPGLAPWPGLDPKKGSLGRQGQPGGDERFFLFFDFLTFLIQNLSLHETSSKKSIFYVILDLKTLGFEVQNHITN